MWLSPAGADHIGLERLHSRLLVDVAPGLDRPDGLEPAPTPDRITNVDNVGGLPAALAIFGGVLATAVLAFVLAGIAKARARDLAIIQALGSTRRQLSGAVAAASLAIVVPATVVGLLAGGLLGRAFWSRVADSLPVVDQPVLPAFALLLIAAGAGLVGCLVSMWPARVVGRRRPGPALRGE